MKTLWERLYSSLAYNIALVVLVVVATATLVYEYVNAETILATTRNLFYDIDLTISVIFLIDYSLGLWLATQKRAYIFSWSGALNLLSSLPFPKGALQAFRVLKIARVLRGIRLVKVAALSESLYLRRKERVNGSTASEPRAEG